MFTDTSRYAKWALAVLVGALLAGFSLAAPAELGPGPQSAEAAFLKQVQKVLAADAQAGDLFGGSVAVSGDTAVVGAILEDGGAGDPLR